MRKTSFPVLVLLSALLLRLLFLVEIIDHPLFIPISSGLDPSNYHRIALQILSGDFQIIYKGTFLYPLILAGIYSFSNILGAKIIQLILGSISCVFIFFITKRIFNKQSAYLASIISIIYPISIIHETILVYTSWVIFLNLGTTWLLLQEKIKVRNIVMAGVLLGLSFVLSPMIVFFIPCCVLWILFRGTSIFNNRNFKLALFFILGFLIIITPFLLRNFIAGGHISPTSPYFGIGFYIGNNPYTEGIFKSVPGIRYSPKGQFEDFKYRAVNTKGKLTPTGISFYWVKKAFKFIKENPIRYLKLEFNKVLLFFNHKEYSDLIQSLDYFKNYSILIRFLSLFSFGIIGPLGLMGIFISIYNRIESKLLIIYILSYLLILLIFYITSRYRLPAIYGFFPFAGYFLNYTITQIGKWNLKKLIFIISGLILCVLFVNMNLSVNAQDRISHYNQGVIYLSDDKLQKAEEEFKKSIRENQHDVNAHFGLGEIYFRQGKYKKAEERFIICLELNPFFLDAYYNLGLTYHKLKRYKKSNVILKKLMKLTDRDLNADFLLFKNYLMLSRCKKAQQQLKKLFSKYPFQKEIINKELKDLEYKRCMK